MNINECGCRPYGWLGLDGNRCIRVIPRQHTCDNWGIFKLVFIYAPLTFLDLDYSARTNRAWLVKDLKVSDLQQAIAGQLSSLSIRILNLTLMSVPACGPLRVHGAHPQSVV